jgi:hypothetical protein
MTPDDETPCPECGAVPGEPCLPWCSIALTADADLSELVDSGTPGERLRLMRDR